MKFRLIGVFCLLVIGNQAVRAQLLVTNDLTIQQYVEEVLLGNNVSVSNITYNGGSASTSNVQVGGFDCPDCNLGIPSGFLMASGDVSEAAGPNDNTSVSGVNNGLGNGSDPDLLDLVQSAGGSSVHNWVILEFDFVPLGDTIQFNYVFASDEYDTFAESGWTDVFGFLLSGPGINGPFTNNAENIALIPGTNLAVAINNCNNGSGNAGPCDNCEFYNQDSPSDSYFFANPDEDVYTNPYYMQYDGYTDVLTAMAIVQCGETYHIKLAICDSGDQGLDSAIFLERESFSSNLVVQAAIQFEAGGPNGNVLFEDCGEALFTLTRPETGDPDQLLIAYLDYSGTAIMGDDYSILPDSVIFDPGVITLSFPLDGVIDGLIEGIEQVHVSILNFAECSDELIESEFDFEIWDTADPLVVTGYTEVICSGATATIQPIIEGGYGVYSYAWSTGESTFSIDVSPLDTTIYNIIVSDTCSMPSDDADIIIEVLATPDISVTIDQGDAIELGCDAITLTATATGGNGDYDWEWYDGNGNFMWSTSNSVWYSFWNGAGPAEVIVTDGCGFTASDVIDVTLEQIDPITVILDDISVPCNTTVNLDPVISGGGETLYYTWYDPAWFWLGSNPQLTYNFGSSTITLQLQVSDGCGNFVQEYVTISVEPIPINISLPDMVTGPCTEVFNLIPVVTGGATTLSFEWTDANGFVASTANLLYSSFESTTLVLNVEDNCSSSATEDVIVNIVNTMPAIDMTDDVVATCIDEMDFTVAAISGAPEYNFSWSVDGVELGTGDLFSYQANETTEIQCVVTDYCGMTDTSSAFLIIDNPAIHLTDILDTVICRGTTLLLTAEATGGAGMLTYEWLGGPGSSDSTMSITPGGPNEYTVIVSDQCEQVESDQVDVDVQWTDASYHIEFFTDVEALFTAAAADSCFDCTYEWDFGDGFMGTEPQTTHIFDGLGQYNTSLTVTNILGCKDVLSAVVHPPVQIYIPNAFTPDGDGLNDVLQFYTNGVIDFEIFIFNRWGEVVYTSTDKEQAWTGAVRNGEHYAENGAYNYLIKYTSVDGDAARLNGSVLILR